MLEAREAEAFERQMLDDAAERDWLDRYAEGSLAAALEARSPESFARLVAMA